MSSFVLRAFRGFFFFNDKIYTRSILTSYFTTISTNSESIHTVRGHVFAGKITHNVVGSCSLEQSLYGRISRNRYGRRLGNVIILFFFIIIITNCSSAVNFIL